LRFDLFALLVSSFLPAPRAALYPWLDLAAAGGVWATSSDSRLAAMHIAPYPWLDVTAAGRIPSMRFLALTLALATLPAMAAEHPLWDGEPIEEYAKKAGLPPTKTLDLGEGVKMEFVIIPAGKFMMGTDYLPKLK